jgi:hypothetical protein
MAYAFVTEFPIRGGDRTTTNYDAVNDKLAHHEAPAGLLLHYAGFDEDSHVFRIVNVWETQAQGQAYLDDKVLPAAREVMGDDAEGRPSRQSSYELHHVLKP